MKRHRGLELIGLLIVCFAAGSALAQTSSSTQSFIHNASVGNQFEISSSRLALQKSSNNDIKQFAQHMVDDHTQIGNQMKDALAKSGAGLPQPATALDARHQKLLNKLNNASGADFDRQYVKSQLAAHKDAVVLFRDYSKNGDNSSLKSFASQALPIIEEHYKRIKQIQASL